MSIRNQIKLSIHSLSENVAIARIAAATFAAQVEFSINDLEEIKVAISEAVSNSVIHGYEHETGIIELSMNLYIDKLEYIITDFGKGIADIELARQASYSTHSDRMGLGFVFMESFMDELEVNSQLGKGTVVRMVRKIQPNIQEH